MSFRATHLCDQTTGEPFCRQRRSGFLGDPPWLTLQLDRVTCDRCLRKLEKQERTRAKNCSVLSEEAG